jgi:ribosome-binding factor A
MTSTGHRHERIAEEILHEVAVMLAGELKDPRIKGLVTATEVQVSPDLRHAKIYVIILGSTEEQDSTIQGLEAATGFVRHELAERIGLRRAPDVRFVLDHRAADIQRIEELLHPGLPPDGPDP